MATRLRILREARGLKAYEIARAVGVSRGQISLIEGGHVLPVPWLAEQIAEVFGLRGRDLFPEVYDERPKDRPEGADERTGGSGPGDPPGLRAPRRGGSTTH